MSKCASCVKGPVECSYMRDMTPVEGWTAKTVAYRTQLGKSTYTYEVIECPAFEPMHKPKKTPRRRSGESTLDHAYAERKQKVLKGCSYGVSHYRKTPVCDGTPNPSQGGKMKREPCKYYKREGLRAGGKCTSSRVR